jgi:hypothetical protein
MWTRIRRGSAKRSADSRHLGTRNFRLSGKDGSTFRGTFCPSEL